MNDRLANKDKEVIWHPYTQHGLKKQLLPISRGLGAYVYDFENRAYLDAISSWWTCIHGHCNPYIERKIRLQLSRLDHLIFSGFTHEPAVRLAVRLLKHLPQNQEKVFYSDNGSTAVEVALKMAIQCWFNRKKPKPGIIAFRNSYHGDTFGAMSVSRRGSFTRPFRNHLFKTHFIDAPVRGKEKDAVAGLKKLLKREKEKIAAFIFEPLVQGAGGMIMYDAEPLDELMAICANNRIFTIADEVMTGFGRTGKFFACGHLGRLPDIVCMSKGLAGGVMALGATSCTGEVFNGFYSSDPFKTFFHGHSFTANPIACSAALAGLDLMEKKINWKKIRMISEKHKEFVRKVSAHPALKNARSCGTIMAIDLNTGRNDGYFDTVRDTAISFFLRKGILIRPLGNVLYAMPPYCVHNAELDYLYKTILEFLNDEFILEA